VRLKVDIIVTHASPNVTAAKQATSNIPIVFAATGDPVGFGHVASLARPGGNVTGLSLQSPDLAGKRLELLRDTIPRFDSVTLLARAENPNEQRDVEAAGRRLGIEVARPEIRRPEDIVTAIETLKGRTQALYIQSDPLLFTNRVRIVTLALTARLATMSGFREFVDAGGLMSYGPNLPDLFRRAAEFVDKILRGTKPADIPVEQPTKFDLLVNLTTAKALGLTVPSTLLARADEVIE
jgi:putative ABC transport system substrate-binding protein